MCNPRSKVHGPLVILFDSDRVARNLNAIGHQALQRKPVTAPFRLAKGPSGGGWVDEWMNGRAGAGGPPLGITTARWANSLPVSTNEWDSSSKQVKGLAGRAVTPVNPTRESRARPDRRLVLLQLSLLCLKFNGGSCSLPSTDRWSPCDLHARVSIRTNGPTTSTTPTDRDPSHSTTVTTEPEPAEPAAPTSSATSHHPRSCTPSPAQTPERCEIQRANSLLVVASRGPLR